MTNNVNCVSDFNANEFIYNAYNKNSDNFYNNNKYSIPMYHEFMNNPKGVFLVNHRCNNHRCTRNSYSLHVKIQLLQNTSGCAIYSYHSTCHLRHTSVS